jgi:hypothetical protein
VKSWGDENIEEVVSVVDSSGQTVFDPLIHAFWEAQEAKVQEALHTRSFDTMLCPRMRPNGK